MMRKPRILSNYFMEALERGVLVELMALIREDPDLMLEIRADYIDIYFKGSCVINLCRSGSTSFVGKTHEKFSPECSNWTFSEPGAVAAFVDAVPRIKQRISRHRGVGSEIELEQLFMRFNNREPKVNSEYFALDRQGIYGPDRSCRIDVLGLFWPREERQSTRPLKLSLMETKFAMGADIGKIADQLDRYYKVMVAVLQTRSILQGDGCRASERLRSYRGRNDAAEDQAWPLRRGATREEACAA
jgi:hypothetical protein